MSTKGKVWLIIILVLVAGWIISGIFNSGDNESTVDSEPTVENEWTGVAEQTGDTRLPVTSSAASTAQAMPAVNVDLINAYYNGQILTTATGSSLQSINISVQSTSDEPLQVTVVPGTLFTAQAGSVQNMVVREQTVFSLRWRGDTKSAYVDAACANMNKNQPGAGDAFSSIAPPPPDLYQLLCYSGFSQESSRVQQFAIWTITDNPSRSGYVGLGSSISTGGRPSDAEIATIRDLFAQAGIDPANYRGLR